MQLNFDRPLMTDPGMQWKITRMVMNKLHRIIAIHNVSTDNLIKFQNIASI